MENYFKSDDTKPILHKELVRYEIYSDDTARRSDSLRDIHRTAAGGLGGASGAVTLALTLCGSMALWSGLMKVAEEAGAVKLLSAVLSPAVGWLFRGLEKGGRAVQLICMNLSANILGLGNATTPLGIRAMEAIQEEEGGSGLRRLRQRQHDNADRPEHSEPSAHSGDRRGAHDRPRSRPTDGNTPLRVDRIGVFPGGFGGRGKAVRAFFQEEGAACR